MPGTSLTKQERECKLYDAFAKFTHIKGESLHTYYLRFTQLINDMNIYKMNMEKLQVNTKFLNSLPPEWRDDSIACLNKAMTFLTAVASSRVTVQQVQRRQGKIILVLIIRVMLRAQGEIIQVDRQGLLNATTVKVNDIWLGNALSLSDKGMLHGQVQKIILHNVAFQTENLDTYDSDCDDLSNAQAVLMANISSYGSGFISKVPNSDNYLNNMDKQSVHALQNFEQLLVMDFTDNKISNDSNIIPYS
nr:hypothetical protein [Tanacetum cinerariifolium]